MNVPSVLAHDVENTMVVCTEDVELALFGNLIPVFTLLFAFTLLGERLNPIQAGGVGLVFPGVLAAAWPARSGRTAETG